MHEQTSHMELEGSKRQLLAGDIREIFLEGISLDHSSKEEIRFQ